jgi:hypothetical protein
MRHEISEIKQADFLPLLCRTLLEPHAWHEVLEALCKLCGAQKALITYRRKSDASIVIPTNVEEQWKSPLIFGFSEEDVGSFLSDFREVDPWTPIEAKYRPYTPYALSYYLSEQAMEASGFSEWLAPQSITDSIVAELAHDATGWTALNLYIDGPSKPALKALQNCLPQVVKYWAMAKSVYEASLGSKPIQAMADVLSEPCLLLDGGNRLVHCNQAAQDLANGGIWKVDKNGIAELPDEWLASQETENPTHVTWIDLCASEYLTGEFVGVRALLVGIANTDTSSPWDEPGLGERERQLVLHVAQGGFVKDGAKLFGISERANANIWKEACKKTGIPKRQDLQAVWNGLTKDEET